MFQGCFMIKGVSRVFQGSFKKTFKVFQESFMCMAQIAASRAEGGPVMCSVLWWAFISRLPDISELLVLEMKYFFHDTLQSPIITMASYNTSFLVMSQPFQVRILWCKNQSWNTQLIQSEQHPCLSPRNAMASHNFFWPYFRHMKLEFDGVKSKDGLLNSINLSSLNEVE